MPGDTSFTLGPHIDGGSIERWEDPLFRKVWDRILQGGSGWKSHDSFDASPRLNAKQDLYNAPLVYPFILIHVVLNMLIPSLLQKPVQYIPLLARLDFDVNH
jgi:hypothetical protein